MVYSVGARVGFFQGDIRLLPDDMKTLQPTIFPVVPRLLNRVYDRVGDLCLSRRSHSALNINASSFSLKSCHQVQSGAATPFKKWLLNFAVDRKYAEVRDGIIRKNSVWDKLIFNKVQVALPLKRMQITSEEQEVAECECARPRPYRRVWGDECGSW